MLNFCLLIGLTLGIAVLSPSVGAAEKRITGQIQVIDGDTFDVGGTRVRLFGIDAPEGDQTCTDARGQSLRCGAFVTTQVRDAYRGKRAICKQVDTDRYGRSVARCVVGNVDVGQNLVASGLAFAFAKYSRDYVAVEKTAITNRALFSIIKNYSSISACKPCGLHLCVYAKERNGAG